MILLPASLLALAVLQVSAIPIDKHTCDPSRLSLILGANWATSSNVQTYCSALFAPASTSKPALPTVEVSSTATATDLRKACECIVAMPQLPPPAQSTSTQDQQQPQQQPALALQQQPRLRLQPPTKEQELKVRGGLVAGQPWQPYGRGALPAPIGSELKGFGARDNLYVRGTVVDGTRDRSS